MFHFKGQIKKFLVFNFCYLVPLPLPHYKNVHISQILKKLQSGWPQWPFGNSWAFLKSFSEMSAEYGSRRGKMEIDRDLKTFLIDEFSKDCVTEMPPHGLCS